jgi:hypothetical protein
MNKYPLYIFFLLLFNSFVFTQDVHFFGKYGQIITLKSSYSMFPHQKRFDGHVYKDKKYSFEEHYNDSTVKVFIPSYFKNSNKVDVVIHFHGWWNNIDSVIKQFKLIEQFYESKKNAILIFPEGPKNSPDSFGGKLEENDVFKKLVNDILNQLKNKKYIKNNKIGNIIISGHSGAYRVISYILQKGGLRDKIKEVYLFDALYGNTEKYVFWLLKSNGKLINIYTNDGGTKEESEKLFEACIDWKIKAKFIEEDNLSLKDLLSNRIIFIHSNLDHNQVLFQNKNFYQYIKSSCLK